MATDPDNREVCLILKRFVYGVTHLITLIITCFYISNAFRHYNTISTHVSALKSPYGNFDLSFEKVGYSFAIGRAIFLAITIIPIAAVPDWLLFVFAILHLVFEIPMAAVAESNFGYSVAFSQLDLSPPDVTCDPNSMSTSTWSFFIAYAKVVGKPTFDVCSTFVHEGSLLRASLLFSWFTLWICWFLIAFLGAFCTKEKKWSDFLIYFTGFEFTGFWSGLKKCFTLPRWRWPRRKTNSEASTLADEEISVKIGEKA